MLASSDVMIGRTDAGRQPESFGLWGRQAALALVRQFANVDILEEQFTAVVL